MLILDAIELTFWYVVLKAYQGVLAFIMLFTPNELVKRIAQKDFAEHKIKLTMADDSKVVGKYDREKYDCEVVVHDPKLFKRYVVEDEMGLGESYMVREEFRVAKEHFRAVQCSAVQCSAVHTLCILAFMLVHPADYDFAGLISFVILQNILSTGGLVGLRQSTRGYEMRVGHATNLK